MESLDSILVEILTKLYSKIIYSEEKIIKDMIGDTLSVKEFHTLEVIYSAMTSKNNTASTIASRLGITLGTCTTNIDRLIVKGLVNKVKNDSDRRVVYIELTEKGVQAHLKHIAMHKKSVAKAISNLSSSDKANLMNIVAKMDI